MTVIELCGYSIKVILFGFSDMVLDLSPSDLQNVRALL